MEPENGKYTTEADTRQFNSWFSKVYGATQPMVDGQCLIKDTSIKNVTIVLTETCNLKCTYCYQHQKTNKALTKELAKETVDFLLAPEKSADYINLQDFPALILDFIGGEPLLNIDVMDYLVDYFKIRALELEHPWGENYMISISSNGILYKDPRFQNFLRKNENRVSIGITIDGTKQLHDSCRVFHDGSGSYDVVEDSVKLWITQKSVPDTKVTLAPENLEFLVESIIHLFKMGIQNVPANVVFEDVWNDKKYPTQFYYLLKELADVIIEEEWYKTHHTSLFVENLGNFIPKEEDQNWCGGDGKMLAVGPDGDCYPCLRYMNYCLSNKNTKPLVIGNIKDGIKTKDEHEGLMELSKITRSSQSTQTCMDCPIGRGCSWCSAFNYDIFGTANKRATFHCEMHKARVMANVYYWNKLYMKLGLLDIRESYIPKEWALEIIDSTEYENLLELTKREND